MLLKEIRKSLILIYVISLQYSCSKALRHELSATNTELFTEQNVKLVIQTVIFTMIFT